MRTRLLNILIEKYGYKSYLEIGLGNPDNNFNHINIQSKASVDPEGEPTYKITSDEFFKVNKQTYDIIFIDGLHLHKQVLRDIDNSLKILNENGIIIIHDTNPKYEKDQQVPRMYIRWTGDVWKAFVQLRMTREDLTMETVDIETGCSLIYPSSSGLPGHQQLIDRKASLTYNNLIRNKKHWLNLITWDKFLKKY